MNCHFSAASLVCFIDTAVTAVLNSESVDQLVLHFDKTHGVDLELPLEFVREFIALLHNPTTVPDFIAQLSRLGSFVSYTPVAVELPKVAEPLEPQRTVRPPTPRQSTGGFVSLMESGPLSSDAPRSRRASRSILKDFVSPLFIESE